MIKLCSSLCTVWTKSLFHITMSCNVYTVTYNINSTKLTKYGAQSKNRDLTMLDLYSTKIGRKRCLICCRSLIEKVCNPGSQTGAIRIVQNLPWQKSVHYHKFVQRCLYSRHITVYYENTYVCCKSIPFFQLTWIIMMDRHINFNLL